MTLSTTAPSFLRNDALKKKCLQEHEKDLNVAIDIRGELKLRRQQKNSLLRENPRRDEA